MNYLARRSGSVNWYYRESLPQDIRELIVRDKGSAPREKWISLGSAGLRAAKAKLPQVRGAQHREWDELRKAHDPISEIPTFEDLTDAVVDFVHQIFWEKQRDRLRGVLGAGLDPSIEAKNIRKKNRASRAISRR